jgi:hypothetical protein
MGEIVKLAAALFACFLLVSIPAHSSTGNDLKETCDLDQGKFLSHSACTGYILGAVEMTELINAAADRSKDKKQFSVCIPAGITYGQIVDVVKKFVDDHPEERHQKASVMVFLAVQHAFPCKK